jgi:hypothetical protein
VNEKDLVNEPTAVETELAQEKVATLARIANTFAAHLERLHRAREGVLAASPAERPARVQRFRELSELVQTWHWYLIVQREANGLRHHEALAELYPIPRLPVPR